MSTTKQKEKTTDTAPAPVSQLGEGLQDMIASGFQPPETTETPVTPSDAHEQNGNGNDQAKSAENDKAKEEQPAKAESSEEKTDPAQDDDPVKALTKKVESLEKGFHKQGKQKNDLERQLAESNKKILALEKELRGEVDDVPEPSAEEKLAMAKLEERFDISSQILIDELGEEEANRLVLAEDSEYAKLVKEEKHHTVRVNAAKNPAKEALKVLEEKKRLTEGETPQQMEARIRKEIADEKQAQTKQAESKTGAIPPGLSPSRTNGTSTEQRPVSFDTLLDDVNPGLSQKAVP